MLLLTKTTATLEILQLQEKEITDIASTVALFVPCFLPKSPLSLHGVSVHLLIFPIIIYF